MNRRNLLKLSAAGAAALASGRALAQATPAFTPMERGTVLPTRGQVTRTALPVNSSANGLRYVTPYRFGLGGTQIGNIFAPISEEQAFGVIKTAWDNGVRYYDTSPFYGYGLSERRVGEFLRRQKRDDFVVSTKIGRVFKATRNPVPNADLWTQPLPFSYEYDFTAAGARRAVEDSLQRLGLSNLDIVFIHDLSPDNTELPGSWTDHYEIAAKGAMPELERMRNEGLIKGWGFGINTPNAAVRAAQSNGPTPDIVLLACQYSLVDHEETVNRTFPALQAKGISVVVGTPLADGFLGGRNRFHFSTNLPAGMAEKRARIAAVADRFGIDIRTAALQFAAAPSIVSAIVPGSRVPGQVEANVQSMKVAIPPAFWEALRSEKLISDKAALPV